VRELPEAAGDCLSSKPMSMSNAERYKKEQDLLFEEIERMERAERREAEAADCKAWLLESPKRTDYVLRLLQSKAFQGLLDTVPQEGRRTWIMDLIRDLEAYLARRTPSVRQPVF
jgi:hypothetical protein